MLHVFFSVSTFAIRRSLEAEAMEVEVQSTVARSQLCYFCCNILIYYFIVKTSAIFDALSFCLHNVHSALAVFTFSQYLCHCSFAAILIYLTCPDFSGLFLCNCVNAGSTAAFLASVSTRSFPSISE